MERPKISILLPIRNEAPWLEQRLASILNQDFNDFELLIGDNASDDGSDDIYSTYAKDDTRIKIFRHRTDIGAANNFKFLFDNAVGEYLIVAGGHDLWSDNYLSLLKDKLDSDSEIVLSFGKTIYIDQKGNELRKARGIYSTEGVKNPARRFNIYMWADQNPIYGMYRREAALEAYPRKKYVIAGQIFLQKMAILGEFAYLHEAVFFRREVRPPESSKQRLSRYQSVLYGRELKVKLSFWRSVLEILSVAFRTPIRNNRRNSSRIRFQLVFSSFTVFARFWSYLW